MSALPISVLIVDDSAVMRNLIGKIIAAADGLVVAGKALNGSFALQKIPSLKPDVIVLDLEMPDMNGIEFLQERKRRGIDIPVIILSSRAERGARITMEAITLGAADFIMKPSGLPSDEIYSIAENLVHLVRGYGKIYQQTRLADQERAARAAAPTSGPDESQAAKEKLAHETPAAGTEAPNRPPSPAARTGRTGSDASLEERISITRAVPPPVAGTVSGTEWGDTFPFEPATERLRYGQIEIVAIGISTGGPNALREVFSRIDREVGVPIIVVQHMPAGFTAEFARSLSKISPLEVKEAEEGDLLLPGRVLIAPGSSHVRVERRKLASVAVLDNGPPVNGHRPSVDVLFESVARDYGANALAVIMTGMGKDGSKELGSVQRAGGVTVAQNEASCVVFGMPKAAIESGVVQYVVPLSEMAGAINWLVRMTR